MQKEKPQYYMWIGYFEICQITEKDVSTIKVDYICADKKKNYISF